MRSTRRLMLHGRKAVVAGALCLSVAGSLSAIPAAHADTTTTTETQETDYQRDVRIFKNIYTSAQNRIKANTKLTTSEQEDWLKYLSDEAKTACAPALMTEDLDQAARNELSQQCRTKVNAVDALIQASAGLSTEKNAAKDEINSLAYLTEKQKADYDSEITTAAKKVDQDQLVSTSVPVDLSDVQVGVISNIMESARTANLDGLKNLFTQYVSSYSTLTDAERNGYINWVGIITDNTASTISTIEERFADAARAYLASAQNATNISVAMTNIDNILKTDNPGTDKITEINDVVTLAAPLNPYSRDLESGRGTPLDEVPGEASTSSKIPTWLWYVIGAAGIGLIGAIAGAIGSALHLLPNQQ
ncbi:MAG: hypothetical protein Q3962_01150 [Corynebacterium sp.]|nr:hypothetical protein [Corynebacterium sp.]